MIICNYVAVAVVEVVMVAVAGAVVEVVAGTIMVAVLVIRTDIGSGRFGFIVTRNPIRQKSGFSI